MTATGGENHAASGWPKPQLSRREDSDRGHRRGNAPSIVIVDTENCLESDVGAIDGKMGRKALRSHFFGVAAADRFGPEHLHVQAAALDS